MLGDIWVNKGGSFGMDPVTGRVDLGDTGFSSTKLKVTEAHWVLRSLCKMRSQRCFRKSSFITKIT